MRYSVVRVMAAKYSGSRSLSPPARQNRDDRTVEMPAAIGGQMSFMRGIVENQIKNMSPQERQEALRTVTAQVIASMNEQERTDALREITAQLLKSLPTERHAEVITALGHA
jgi:hypothetical protein